MVWDMDCTECGRRIEITYKNEPCLWRTEQEDEEKDALCLHCAQERLYHIEKLYKRINEAATILLEIPGDADKQEVEDNIQKAYEVLNK